MSKTTIIFVRHGTVKNTKQIIYGRLPGFKLSNEGEKQIKKTADDLKNFPVDLVFTSPLLRAMQSASIIGKMLDIKPKIDNRLIEIKNIFQGISLEKYKRDIQPHQFDDEYVRRGQESIPHIRQRMLKFISAIRKKYKGKTIIAVSHGDPIVILRSAFEGKEFTWNYKKNNYLQTGGWFLINI